MVKTFADELCKDIYKKGLNEKFSEDPKNNIDTLDNIVRRANISKCSLSELEIIEEGTTLQLKYLLQKNSQVSFGLCDYFKVWKNYEGWQYGCWLDKGEGRRIQVYCKGKYPDFCERLEKYKQYIEANHE